MKKQIYIKLPLFWKFVLSIVSIVVLFGSINAYLIWKNVRRSLENELEKRVFVLGKSLAEQTVTPLLFEDYVTVQKLLDDVKRLDETVLYAFILSESENLIAYSYDFQIPTEIININTSTARDTSTVVIYKLKQENEIIVRDIALPILSGKLGTARIGISEENISINVSKSVSDFWIMVGFFLLVGIIGAFVFALFITKPINKIREVSDNITLADLKNKTVPRIRAREKLFGTFNYKYRALDEIDLLTEKFNEMISRLEEAYQNLELTQKHLIHSEKLASIGTISAGLAHEINNPIAGIKNCLRRIENTPNDMEQNKKYLILIAEAIDRIEKVIKGLLNYAHKEDLVLKPVDIKEIIEKALLLIGHRLEKARITLSKEINPDVNFIQGSQNHIEQVFINLLLNSIDAITEKQNKKANYIHIKISNYKQFVKIIIEDSGVGIPEENIPKIFDPFFTTKIRDKGTGLGLSIISKIVKDHGGTIEVESSMGQYTKFTLYFLAAQRSEQL